MSVTIQAGQRALQDPSDIRIYDFDWDGDNFPSGVQISGAATWTITAVAPTTATLMTKDQESLLTAAQATTALGRTVTGDNRVAQVRLQGGDAGALYNIACKITTNETPSQTKEQSFVILVRQR